MGLMLLPRNSKCPLVISRNHKNSNTAQTSRERLSHVAIRVGRPRLGLILRRTGPRHRALTGLHNRSIQAMCATHLSGICLNCPTFLDLYPTWTFSCIVPFWGSAINIITNQQQEHTLEGPGTSHLYPEKAEPQSWKHEKHAQWPAMVEAGASSNRCAGCGLFEGFLKD